MPQLAALGGNHSRNTYQYTELIDCILFVFQVERILAQPIDTPTPEQTVRPFVQLNYLRKSAGWYCGFCVQVLVHVQEVSKSFEPSISISTAKKYSNFLWIFPSVKTFFARSDDDSGYSCHRNFFSGCLLLDDQFFMKVFWILRVRVGHHYSCTTSSPNHLRLDWPSPLWMERRQGSRRHGLFSGLFQKWFPQKFNFQFLFYF